MVVLWSSQNPKKSHHHLKRRVEWCGCDHKVRVPNLGDSPRGISAFGWGVALKECVWSQQCEENSTNTRQRLRGNDYCHHDNYPRSTGTWVWSNDADRLSARCRLGCWKTVKTEAKGDISISEAGEVLQKKWLLPTSSNPCFWEDFYTWLSLSEQFFQLVETFDKFHYIPFNIPNACVDFSEVPFNDERSQVCSWWSWDVSHHIRGGRCELVRSPTGQKAVGFVRICLQIECPQILSCVCVFC